MDAIGIQLTLPAASFEDAIRHLRPYVSFDPAPLMEEIAALGESQTRRRITDEKTAPDGAAWPKNWAGTSILFDTGQHLLQSIASTSSAEEAVWGSSWEFAHVHQEGMVIHPRNGQALKFWFVRGGFTEFVVAKSVTIPKREFVGLSQENRTEIEELVTDHFGRLGR